MAARITRGTCGRVLLICLGRNLQVWSQIINANLELVSRAVEPAAAAEVIEENRALVRQLDLAASLRTWLALQGHVNSLLDSTTAGPAAKGDVQVRSHVLNVVLLATYLG